MAVVVLAVGTVIGLIWLGQAPSPPPPRTVATSGNLKGDPTAPVEIEEWADFQCPACRQFAQTVGRQVEETLVAQGRARVVFHHFAFLGQESLWAAAAAECAKEQERFWDYHDKLFAEQAGENRGAFSQANLKRFAADLGLDAAAFAACVDSGRGVAAVQADIALGRAKGVQVTPTLFVAGQKIEGVPTLDQLRRLVDVAAGAMLRRGTSA